MFTDEALQFTVRQKTQRKQAVHSFDTGIIVLMHPNTNPLPLYVYFPQLQIKTGLSTEPALSVLDTVQVPARSGIWEVHTQGALECRFT